MQTQVTLSFVAPSLADFTAALAALKEAGISPVADISPPQNIKENCGPLETRYLTMAGKKFMRVPVGVPREEQAAKMIADFLSKGGTENEDGADPVASAPPIGHVDLTVGDDEEDSGF